MAGLVGPGRGGRWIDAILRSAFDFVVVYDGAGVVRYVSSTVRAFTGVDGAQVGERMALLDRVHPEDRGRVQDLFIELRDRPGQSCRCEVRILRADDELRWLELMATNLLDDPDVGGIVANGRDITEQMEAVEAKAHLAAVVESSEDAIVTTSLDG